MIDFFEIDRIIDSLGPSLRTWKLGHRKIFLLHTNWGFQEKFIPWGIHWQNTRSFTRPDFLISSSFGQKWRKKIGMTRVTVLYSSWVLPNSTTTCLPVYCVRKINHPFYLSGEDKVTILLYRTNRAEILNKQNMEEKYCKNSGSRLQEVCNKNITDILNSKHPKDV